MDNEPADETTDSRGDLATWLDDYAAGRCDRAQMQASFLEICRSNPEAPWDALALLDQYQRRGRIDASLARSLKSDIAQLVFGVIDQTEDEEEEEEEEDEEKELQSPQAVPEPAAPPPASADTTGTRWRKLMVDRDEQPAVARRENAFVDPVQFNRDVEPLTRPPPPKVRQTPSNEGTSPGSILRDRYELLTILGRGSSGTVYKALDRHRAHLDVSARCVAVRVLKLNYRDSPHALAELEQQFHQAQSLAHPNIVSVFDLDRDGGTFFMVMELLEGELLLEVLDRLDHRAMARDRALSIIGSIGAALAHAHRRGVVHADLRPGNVMLASNGDVKVMDFGFVRRQYADPKRNEPWIGDAPLAASPQTSTLAYSSEERVNGDSAQPSDDVYSLACIAYEMLSGHHPFGGRSAPLARAQGRKPQRVKGLNRTQWSTLQMALQWAREDRKIDVIGLLAGLGCAEVPQRLVSPEQIVASRPRRERSGSPTAAIVTLLLLAGGAYAYWQGYLRIPAIDSKTLPIATVSEPAQGSPSSTASSEPVVESPAVTVPSDSAAASTPATVAAAPVNAPSNAPSTKPAAAPTEPPAAKTDAGAASPPEAQSKSKSGPSRIAFDKDTYVATESDGAVRLVVRRSGGLRSTASFQWTLLPNSAVAGDDFAAIGPGVEQFKPGATSVTLTIPLVSDAIKESTELFLVELRAVDNSTELGDLSRAAVLIVDDD
ncbi:MAG: serine/threonine protein kinase [Povalibacter sp.]